MRGLVGLVIVWSSMEVDAFACVLILSSEQPAPNGARSPISVDADVDDPLPAAGRVGAKVVREKCSVKDLSSVYRKPIAKVAVASAVVVLAGAVGLTQLTSSAPTQTSTGHSQAKLGVAGPVVARSDTGPSAAIPKSSVVFNVLNYGADATGTKDSTAAIASAIRAAEASPGSEVYFPAGTFLLDQPSPKMFDFVISSPINIVGAGVGLTKIVNKVGMKTPGVYLSTVMFEIVPGPLGKPGGGDGSTISGLTLDAATYDAGTAIMDFANHTILTNLSVLAAKSTNIYNPNVFGVRVIAICNPYNLTTVYRIDNVVNNVTIVGQGAAGNTELDLSCQVGSSVSNVKIVGNGLDIFYCNNDSFTNINLTGGDNGSTQYITWALTGSSNITMSNIVTNGQGGVIEPDPLVVSSNISINSETMQNLTGFLKVGDSSRVAITNSQIAGLAFVPAVSVSDVAVSTSTVGRIFCKPGMAMLGFVGVACP